MTFRALLDEYKACRSAWEASGKPSDDPGHLAMVEASNRLVLAINTRAGIPRSFSGGQPFPPVGVLDDDGRVFLVVDNDWGQEACIDSFVPFGASEILPESPT